MLYGMETVSRTRRQDVKLEVADLKLLRFSLVMTRRDKIRNDYFRGTTYVRRFRDKIKGPRLRSFEHVEEERGECG